MKSPHTPVHQNDISESAAMRVRSVADRFSAAIRGQEKEPQIEEYLDSVADPDRHYLLFELVAEELEVLDQQGHHPRLDDYLNRFPHYESAVRGAFCHVLAGSANMPPRLIGTYEVKSCLGDGGFGLVYCALDVHLSRLVAIKVPRIPFVTHPRDWQKYMKLLRSEAQKATTLDHPNVARVLYFEEDPFPYLVMPFVEGQSLDKLLSANRIFSQEEILGLIRSLADALRHAHGRGLIHQDLKPGNVMIPNTMQPIIIDFGLAVPMDEQRVGNANGTLDYLSPEQIRGHKLDGRTDIWSLGVILYELLTGRRPFGVRARDVITQITEDAPVPPSQLRPGISTRLEQICLRCLEKSRDRRYKSAQRLIADLTTVEEVGATVSDEDLTPESEAKHRNSDVVDSVLFLSAHTSPITSVSWTPDGSRILTGAMDNSVRIWNATTGEQVGTFGMLPHRVIDTRVSPNGALVAVASEDQVVRVYDITQQNPVAILRPHFDLVTAVDWVDDAHVVTASLDKRIRFWSIADPRTPRTLDPVFGRILCMRLSADRQTLAVGTESGEIVLLALSKNATPIRLKGHRRPVNDVSWTPDGTLLASASDDATLRIWNALEGLELQVHEVFSSEVVAVAFSPDGNILAARSNDQEIRIFVKETEWRSVHSVNVFEKTSRRGPCKIAFGPVGVTVAYPTSRNKSLCLCRLDYDKCIAALSSSTSVVYSNAKAVLVGDSGVGKTKLAIRLVEDRWDPSDQSSRGMTIYTLQSDEHREILLWDLAGQPEYRLIHQMFMNETTLALCVYDPTESETSLSGISYWLRVLNRVVTPPPQKILIAARTDVGRARKTRQSIVALCEKQGFLGHFETSAKKGDGCQALRDTIASAINWDNVPTIESILLFREVKHFLASVRNTGRVLEDIHKLRERFLKAGSEITIGQFATVVGHVENAGLVRRLSFGRLVLLKPELLDTVASSIIDAARSHPSGLGCVEKADALRGSSEDLDPPISSSDRVLLNHATVEEMVRVGICYEQDGRLVFPSKLNEEGEFTSAELTARVRITLDTDAEFLYASLVIRFVYGGWFSLIQLEKGGAVFASADGGYLALRAQGLESPFGTFVISSADLTKSDDLRLFLSVARSYLDEKGIIYKCIQIVQCSHCRRAVADIDALAAAIENKVTRFPCQYCYQFFPIGDSTLERLADMEQAATDRVLSIENTAKARLLVEGDIVSVLGELQTREFHQLCSRPGTSIVWIGRPDKRSPHDGDSRLNEESAGDLELVCGTNAKDVGGRFAKRVGPYQLYIFCVCLAPACWFTRRGCRGCR